MAGAAGTLDSADRLYDPALFVAYTRRIIELMGGAGPAVETVAREIYDDWAEHHHFSLYDDVAGHAAGAARARRPARPHLQLASAARRRFSRTSSSTG